jgi:hypothetical protein
VEALTLSTLAFVVGRLDVEGWRVYLTSSGEPTTVCDRCRAAHPSAVLILDAATDQVRENLHQVGVA